MKSSLIAFLSLGLLASTVLAQDKPDLTNPKQKTSYALGVDIGTGLKGQGVEVDAKALSAGLIDAITGKPTMTQKEIADTLRQLQQDLVAKAQEKEKADAAKYGDGAKNLREGTAFLAANAKKEGVKTTASGLQYKVLKSGTGPSPKKTDSVTVHYHGTLTDGTVFDSSVDRGEPVEFGVDQVISGWTEALQMMKVGDKWQLFIPSKLAYDDQNRGAKIGPNTALIFEVELLGIKKAN